MLNRGPLYSALARVSGFVATYTPRSGSPVNVRVIPGKSDASRQMLAGQSQVDSRLQSWVLSLQEYSAEPQVGDRLQVFYRGMLRTWEVRAEGMEQCWQWSDAGSTHRHIMVVEVSA